MSGRYSVLTQDDFSAHEVRWEVQQLLSGLSDRAGMPSDKQHINILDWGCGRGASVGKLLDEGFNAFGVEIDEGVLDKGFSVLEERGYDPNSVIVLARELSDFPDGFFHVIFSEEVLEHVEDIEEVAEEMSRLSRPAGVGVHLFPGSRRFIEPHLFMPLVHWLPKNRMRQLLIAVFLFLKIGPRWPHVQELGIRDASEVYRSYLDKHTYYRDSDSISRAFLVAGFETECRTPRKLASRCAPKCLRKNGFGGDLALFTQKICT